MAASTAEPPAFRISTPACVANGFAAATIPLDLDSVLEIENSGVIVSDCMFLQADRERILPKARIDKNFMERTFKI